MNPTKIKIAIAGVGNLTNALVQGLFYYSGKKENELLHPKLAGYGVSDIEIVASFDVDARKVGKDLSEAIFAKPNKMNKIIEVPFLNVMVNKAPTLDGISQTTEKIVQISKKADVNVAEVLTNSEAEILIISIPSGADQSAKYFAKACLEAGCALINATPSPISRNYNLARKFKMAGIPILGDDLQSQSGGTAFHKGLLKMLQEMGVEILNTYQLDVSGGLEGLNTIDYERKLSKRKVKEESISRSLKGNFNIASGSTDYLDFLGSLRVGNSWIEGKTFLGQPVKIDIRMETNDGASGAASLVDVIRIAKIALNRAAGGAIIEICSYLFKAPPMIINQEKAYSKFKKFANG